jgi:hypothetical protein
MPTMPTMPTMTIRVPPKTSSHVKSKAISIRLVSETLTPYKSALSSTRVPDTRSILGLGAIRQTFRHRSRHRNAATSDELLKQTQTQ